MSVLLGSGFFYFDLLVPLGVASGTPYIALVALSIWSPQKRFTQIIAVISTILIILGFLFSPTGNFWVAVLNRFLAIAALWVTSILLLIWRKTEEDRKQLSAELSNSQEEVKVLSHLLPICANCKKIRDDEGNWNQVDEYLRDHSESLISHGICPDCIEELYPDLKE
ncbi:hypothetical protein E3V33_06035 [Candidatus Marinimicrobia bacterium MT.SAG.4]|nr:hypothetical protein E3V33_06035 [Candidatus Marinimicrobia bacterium MT.SAG.4]